MWIGVPVVEFVIVVNLITVAPVARFAFFNPDTSCTYYYDTLELTLSLHSYSQACSEATPYACGT